MGFRVEALLLTLDPRPSNCKGNSDKVGHYGINGPCHSRKMNRNSNSNSNRGDKKFSNINIHSTDGNQHNSSNILVDLVEPTP